MAKFRKNHERNSSSNGFMIRGIIFTLVLVAILVFGFSKFMNSNNNNLQKGASETNEDSTNSLDSLGQFYIDINDRDFLPKDEQSYVVHHSYYSLGYHEKTEQANWVAYSLTKPSLRVKNVARERYFKPDYSVHTRSAFFRDYSNSGYTKGHLAPAGDMAFNKKAMKESFFMSNISPQIRKFNNGVWKELEENTRDWAYQKGEIFVVSGPIFYGNNYKKIGQNKVGVPDAFYKILLDKSESESIAFIIPHEKTDLPLSQFATSINEVESVVNIDFFYRFFKDDNEEESIEKIDNLKPWKINNKRYKERVNKWNKQD
ncbi:MAG: DNA/RNA non-specific endonuclease [Saprospiraceae bacterium]|nr:DNA/RNA non-specific endonuclease [Bacteroidia bacterium]NNL92240.1 DNA/RNA non-specific endonuclease [Saprospiraceae bacterium]